MNTMTEALARATLREFEMTWREIDRPALRAVIDGAIERANINEPSTKPDDETIRALKRLPEDHALLVFGQWTELLPDGRMVGCPLMEFYEFQIAEEVDDETGEKTGEFETTGWQSAFIRSYDRALKALLRTDEDNVAGLVLLTGERRP